MDGVTESRGEKESQAWGSHKEPRSLGHSLE